jgi:hypothetical protein
MDAKITLSFDEEVIAKAKAFSNAHNISLSRLTEFVLRKITTTEYQSLEDLPVADWVNILAEGPVEYNTKAKKRKKLKDEYFQSQK